MPVSRWCSRADFGELSRIAGTQPAGQSEGIAAANADSGASPRRGAPGRIVPSPKSVGSESRRYRVGRRSLGADFLAIKFVQVEAPRCYRRTDRHRVACSEPTPGDRTTTAVMPYRPSPAHRWTP
jgi:hypothetical protein